MMKRFFLYILFSMILLPVSSRLQRTDTVFVQDNPVVPKKRPLRAAVETVGLNVAVWGFNRYVTNEDFARISFRSVGKNIRRGFVWDNDQFSTNLFAHPYHGNLYFNTARSNGMSFWESVPYALGGSLMWEFCGETEPAAINDLLATTIGGTALGEVTHRLSALVLDDSKRGANRFLRELGGTLINPMNGLNRIISGDAWRVRHRYYRYHDFDRIPVKCAVSAGDRYLADHSSLFRGKHSFYLKFQVLYGDPMQEEGEPYDFFTLRTVFNAGGNQPLVGAVNLTAKLLGRYVEPVPGHRMMVGLFQHFNYYDSESVVKGSDVVPYKISEAASFGAGLIYELPQLTPKVSIVQTTYCNLILLGGSFSDYYRVIDRDYNMGSGYSISSNTTVSFYDRGSFSLDIRNYHIFTWKGYRPQDLEVKNPLFLNAQGDKGNARLTVINPSLRMSVAGDFRFNLEASYYFRSTYYSYHPTVNFHTFETMLGLEYLF